MSFDIISDEGETYRTKVTALFYSTEEDLEKAKKQLRVKLLECMGDSFEGIVSAEKMD